MTKNGRWIAMRNTWLRMEFQTGEKKEGGGGGQRLRGKEQRKVENEKRN